MDRLPVEQMFMIGFRGSAGKADICPPLTMGQQRPGGFILFDRNVDGGVQNFSSPDQLLALTGTLRKEGGGDLLVAVDQEGGQVCRLKERDGFAPIAGAQELARLDPSAAETAMAVLAGELAAFGINFNLAPVVDLAINPENPIIARFGRSFGADPLLVAELASLFVRCHHRRGIACCLKHFPGHGSSRGDTHLGFVDITDQWRAKELEPYAIMTEKGLADAVMLAHVVNRRLDPRGWPASLSPPVVRLLRSDVGFSGVIVCDDLQMRAVTDRFSCREAVRLAVLAGVDLMIIGNNLAWWPDVLQQGCETIGNMLERGEIGRADLEARLARIAALKEKISGVRPWNDNRPTA